MKHPFKGGIPAVMMPCDSRGKPQISRLIETAQGLIDAGMSAVVVNGSMGSWPDISPKVRRQVVVEFGRTNIPFIVGTGNSSTMEAADLAKHAANNGAHGLMIIPRQSARVGVESAQEAHFGRILECGLPSVIYNSPYYGFQTRASLFFRLSEAYDNLVGFKEFGGKDSLSYAAEHITSADENLVLLVGVDTQVRHGYMHCGATGTITGIGNVLPEQVLELIELCEKAATGNPEATRRSCELESAMSVLATFDEGPDLVQYYKHLMTRAGYKGFETPLVPGDVLTSQQAAHADREYDRFLEWWNGWMQ